MFFVNDSQYTVTEVCHVVTNVATVGKTFLTVKQMNDTMLPLSSLTQFVAS